MQTLLAILADLDFTHERELERIATGTLFVRNSEVIASNRDRGSDHG
jgi:hypothetical protein